MSRRPRARPHPEVRKVVAGSRERLAPVSQPFFNVRLPRSGTVVLVTFAWSRPLVAVEQPKSKESALGA